MTNGEFMVLELMKKTVQYDQLDNEIIELESDLCGMEIEYKDYEYAIVEHIDGDNAIIFCESDDNSWNESITLGELLEIVRR